MTGQKTVFITAIGGDIASAALRCIRRGYHGGRIIGCDIQPYVQGIDDVDDFFLVPPYTDENAYQEFIQTICIEQKVTHFFPMGEQEILIAAKHRAFFEAAGILLLIHNDRLLQIATSKYRTAQFLRDNGLPAPRTCYQEAYAGEYGYPLILKADYGCGSKTLQLIHDKEEWQALPKRQEKEYVVQEYIGDAAHEYTCGVFSDGTRTASITYRRLLGFGGMSVRVETVADPKLTEIADRTAKLLGLRGCINIQMRKNKEGYSIFEINPRISSTVGFRDKMGFHDAVWWLQAMDGEAIDFPGPVRAGIVGIKTLDEKVFPETVDRNGDDYGLI